MYLGDYQAGDIIDFAFTTRDGTGVPTSLLGSPVFSIYKANNTTETTSGTLSVDYDSRTGLNQIHLDTSADTSFFVDGQDYMIVITAGSVASISVIGEVIAHFSLRKRADDTGIFRGSVTGTTTTTSLIDSTLTQADTDFWKGRSIIFITGALKYQATNITGFTPGTDTLTFTALTNAPANTDQYIIV
jgi:hypothetical protein